MSHTEPGHVYGENEKEGGEDAIPSDAELLDMEICSLCMGSGEVAGYEGETVTCPHVIEDKKQRDGEAQGDMEREAREDKN